MTAQRAAIPEDLEHDPTYARQRELGSYLLGIAINALGGWRTVFDEEVEPHKLAAHLREIALENGLVTFDEAHHAPACRANNWSRQKLPEGRCTCGAAPRRSRS